MAIGTTYRAVLPRDPYAGSRKRRFGSAFSGAPEPDEGETVNAEHLKRKMSSGSFVGSSYEDGEHLKRKKSSGDLVGKDTERLKRKKSSESFVGSSPKRGFSAEEPLFEAESAGSVQAPALSQAVAPQAVAPQAVSTQAQLLQQASAGSANTANTSSNTANSANTSANTANSSAAGSSPHGSAYAGYDIDRGISDLYSALYKKLMAYGVTSIPNFNALYAMFESFLRPSIENAIRERRASGRRNMAELDADAYARGMGSSSYLSSVKAREQDAVESDITGLEGKYSGSMSEYLYKAVSSMQELENEMTRKKMELEEQARARAEQRRFEREKLEAQRKENARLQREKLEAERLMAEMNNKAKMELEKEKNRQRTKELAAKQKAAAEKERTRQQEAAEKERKKKQEAAEKEKKKQQEAAAKARKKAEEEKKKKAEEEKNAKKYGHNKKGAYFDGKWYDGDFSYLEKKKYGYNDYAKYLKNLSASERYLFFTSDSREWRTRRWQVQYNLPEVDYNDLYAEFMPSGDVSKRKPTRRPKSKKWQIQSY